MSETIKRVAARLLDVPRFERIYGKFGGLFRQNGPVILAYHRVIPLPGEEYPFDKGLISADPDTFERQLIFVKRNFNVTNFRIIDEMGRKGEVLPPGSLVITFDDGYADNLEFAYPLLKKHELTATVFVTTGVVDKGDVFWFEKVSWYLRCLPSFDLRIESLHLHEHVDERNREDVRIALLGMLKNVPNTVRLNALAELESISGLTSPAGHSHLVKTLTWDQIVELDRAGIEIGSHTVSHPVLSSMEENEVRDELVLSKKLIEEKLGHEVVSLSYPVGGKSAFNSMVERIAAESGYRFGLSYVSGMNADFSKPFSLKRIHIERDLPFTRLAAELYFPQFFFTN